MDPTTPGPAASEGPPRGDGDGQPRGPQGSSEAARRASMIVRAARECVVHARMDRDAFAAYLGMTLGADIPPEELEFWELGGSMPGDVLLLCAAVIREVADAVPGLALPPGVRRDVERFSRGLPRLAPDDPIREALGGEAA